MELTEQLAQLTSEARVIPGLAEYLARQEIGDAELFSTMFSSQVVFDHSERQWFLWDGYHWKPDLTGQVFGLVGNQLAAEYLQAATGQRQVANQQESEQFVQRSRALLNVARVEHVLKAAAKQPDIAIKGTEWETQPMVLPVSNGILNLRNGSFRAAVSSDYVRAYAPAEWHGLDHPAARWERVLLQIFNDDEDLVAFFRRLCGYAVSGDRREQVLPILWGQGANGKSTIVDTLCAVLGRDFCFTTQSDSLMDLGRGDANGARPFIYALRNKRLVFASESGEGRRLNAGLIKQLTGDELITARPLYGGPVTFHQRCTIMLITNNCPRVPNSDDFGVWRRLKRIAFNRRFVENPKSPEEFRRDPMLSKQLLEELPGILAWLVRGCLEWQRNGLNPPQSVQESTEQYRQDEDVIGQFSADRLLVQTGLEATARDIYGDYKSWCEELGHKPVSSQAFGKRMTAHFGTAEVQWKNGKSQRVYQGVGLLSSE